MKQQKVQGTRWKNALFFSDLFISPQIKQDPAKPANSSQEPFKYNQKGHQLHLSHGYHDLSSERFQVQPPTLSKSPQKSLKSAKQSIDNNNDLQNQQLRLSGHQLKHVKPMALNLDNLLSPKFVQVSSTTQRQQTQENMEQDKKTQNILHNMHQEEKIQKQPHQFMVSQSPKIGQFSPANNYFHAASENITNFQTYINQALSPSLGHSKIKIQKNQEQRGSGYRSIQTLDPKTVPQQNKHRRDLSMDDVMPGNQAEQNKDLPILKAFKELCQGAVPSTMQPRMKAISFLSLFTVGDLIKLQSTCIQMRKLISQDSDYVKILVAYGFLQDELRVPFWSHSLVTTKTLERLAENCVLDHQQEQTEKKKCYDINEYYRKIMDFIEQPPNWLTNEQDIKFVKKVNEQIAQDINRTFHTQYVQTQRGKHGLKHLLLSTAFSNSYIGYCQGMNFLAGSILSIVTDECQAYLIFQGLLYQMDVFQIYYPRVPGLHLRDYQLEHLIKCSFPKLFAHLNRIQMKPAYFTAKWIMTLFTCYLNQQLIPKILDYFVLFGWKAFFNVALAIVQIIEPTLLELQLQEACIFFRDQNRKQDYEAREILRLANQVNIKDEELQRLEEQYYLRLAEDKLLISFRDFEAQNERIVPFNDYYNYIQNLNDQSNKIEPDQTVALSFAKAELIKLEPITREDIRKFQKKLELCERQMEIEYKKIKPFDDQYPILKSQYDTLKDSEKMLKETIDQMTKRLHSNKQKVKLDRFTTIHKNKFLYLANMSSTIRSEHQKNETQEIMQNELIQQQIEAAKKKYQQVKKKPKRKIPIGTQIKQLQADIAILGEKMKKIQIGKYQAQTKLNQLNAKYSLNKMKVDDLIEKKKSIKDQLNGFLIMYELKKQSILKALSQNLRKCKMFKQYRLF